MDQKAAYEITIAEKLEQLSAPGMVDAIWARIETQLDIDMPTDDSPPGGHSPSGGSSWNITGIILFIAALIATIYFTNKKTTSTSPDTGIDSTATISSPGSASDKPPPQPVIPGRLSAPGTRQNTVTPPVVIVDSNTSNEPGEPVIPLPGDQADSLAVAPPVFFPADTIGKKPRGVKGITDEDYRIVPKKKDST